MKRYDSMFKKIKRSKGFALVLTLGIVSLIIVFGTIAATKTLSAMTSSTENTYADQAYLNAKSALDLFVDELTKKQTNIFDDKSLDYLLQKFLLGVNVAPEEEKTLNFNPITGTQIDGEIKGSITKKLMPPESRDGVDYSSYYDITIRFESTYEGYTRRASVNLWWTYDPFSIFDSMTKPIVWDFDKLRDVSSLWQEYFKIHPVYGGGDTESLAAQLDINKFNIVPVNSGAVLAITADLSEYDVIFIGSDIELKFFSVQGNYENVIYGFFDVKDIRVTIPTVYEETDVTVAIVGGVKSDPQLVGQASAPFEWKVEYEDYKMQPSFRYRPPIASYDGKTIDKWTVISYGK